MTDEHRDAISQAVTELSQAPAASHRHRCDVEVAVRGEEIGRVAEINFRQHEQRINASVVRGN